MQHRIFILVGVICYLLTAFAEFMCEGEKVVSLWDHFPAILMQLDYIITW